MLNYNAKSTFQDSTGYSWDYYRDDQKGSNPDPNLFYIIPKPQFVFDNSGKPSIQFHTYQTDDANNGSGFCRFDVELSIPDDIQTKVSEAILANPTKFPGVTKPNFQTLDLNPGSTAEVKFVDQGDTLTFVAQASNYGGDTAAFLMKLSKTQLASLKSSFTTAGGALELKYYLNVPSRLQGVSAVLKFDSSAAYDYQVTQPTYNGWGDQTSPGSAQGFLTDSQSSKVTLTWGIESPPADMVKTVTDWANKTLSSLVSAAVAKVIALQKITSSQSFKISEVESFTSNYVENMVVDWAIQPTAALPSFTDLGLSISDFESNINNRQQQMIVTTNVPFAGTLGVNLASTSNGSVTAGLSSAKKVKSITVTVKYPTLSEANSTHTFTANGSNTFLAPFDTGQGNTWSLDYTVDYADSNVPTISGTVSDITTNQEYLKLEQVGFLAVKFDATTAFGSSEFAKPDEVIVDFSYVNTKGVLTESINQKLNFKASDKDFVKYTESIQARPISNGYNYQVTYVYNGVKYVAPLQSNVTGFSQIVSAVNVVSTTNLIVYAKGDSVDSDPILEVDVKMWFDNPSKVPDNIRNNPTQTHPATFSMSPDTKKDSNNNDIIFGKAQFTGVEIANAPIVYSASITSASGQNSIPPQKIMQNFPSVFLNATQRYFTLEVNLGSIDWATAGYDAIQVIPTFSVKSNGIVTTGEPADTGIQWNKGEVESKYHTVGYKDGDTVTYDLEVNYISKGKDPVTKKVSAQTSIVFDVQAVEPAAAMK